MIEALRAVIKRLHYPLEVMLTCVRWYVAYPLSLRHIEETMAERSVFVDHATIHRWADLHQGPRPKEVCVYYWLWVSRQVGFSGNVMKLRRFGDIG